MLFSENIYFLILFTLPAAMNVVYNAHVRRVPVMKQDKSVELAECVIFCFAVFMCNILFFHKQMMLFAEYSLLQESDRIDFCLRTKFNYIDFMIKYFLLNMFTSIGVIISWYTVGQKILDKIRNVINKICDRPQELKYADVWSNVFETTMYIDSNDMVLWIGKGGEMVTAGVIMVFSPPNQEKREFFLTDTLIRGV